MAKPKRSQEAAARHNPGRANKKTLKRPAKKIKRKPVSRARGKISFRKAFVRKARVQKEELMSEQLKVQETKFSIAKETVPERALPGELPHSYGRDRLVILARDPRWIYAYWELSRVKDERLLNAAKVLRVYDVSRIVFTGANARRFFDVEIPGETDNWYIDTGDPGRSWCVELGARGPDRRFIPLLRSNTITAPPEGPSNIADEEWMVPEETFARLYGMGLGFGRSSPAGKAWLASPGSK